MGIRLLYLEQLLGEQTSLLAFICKLWSIRNENHCCPFFIKTCFSVSHDATSPMYGSTAVIDNFEFLKINSKTLVGNIVTTNINLKTINFQNVKIWRMLQLQYVLSQILWNGNKGCLTVTQAMLCDKLGS